MNYQNEIVQDWNKSLTKGKIKEKIFQEDFLDYLNIGFLDVSEDKNYQKSDIDIVAQALSSIDVKTYNDNRYISLEEESVIEKNILGWIYKSESAYFAFVSTKTRTILLLRNDKNFKNWWKSFRMNYPLITQKTERGTSSWHSSHRNVPIKDLNISWYKKNRL